MSVSFTCSQIVVPPYPEPFYHQSVRIALTPCYVDKAACALELIGGDVALPEHVQLAVGDDRMRV